MGAIWETYVLNQILRARAAAGSVATVFFWREAHGTEVDFIIEHGGRLRLVEAKWAEQIREARLLASLLKVKQLLGERAANEHFVVCRTPHAHTIPGHADIRLIDGFHFDACLGS